MYKLKLFFHNLLVVSKLQFFIRMVVYIGSSAGVILILSSYIHYFLLQSELIRGIFFILLIIILGGNLIYFTKKYLSSIYNQVRVVERWDRFSRQDGKLTSAYEFLNDQDSVSELKQAFLNKTESDILYGRNTNTQNFWLNFVFNIIQKNSILK